MWASTILHFWEETYNSSYVNLPVRIVNSADMGSKNIVNSVGDLIDNVVNNIFGE